MYVAVSVMRIHLRQSKTNLGYYKLVKNTRSIKIIFNVFSSYVFPLKLLLFSEFRFNCLHVILHH